MIAPIITAAMLRRAGACDKQLRLFERTFPDGAEVTMENAQKYGAMFRVEWVACSLLEGEALEAYLTDECIAHKAYESHNDAAFAVYKKARSDAWESYLDGGGLAAYEAEERKAWESYLEARRPALEAYQTARAVAFARAYIAQEEG